MQKKYLNTQDGPIVYEFSAKKVKNINLRIRDNGTIYVSAPAQLPFERVEKFLNSKEDWIIKNQKRILSHQKMDVQEYSHAECLATFSAISDIIFPIFQDILQGEKPTLKIRTMKTRWGVCNPSKKIITLNTALMAQPKEAQEYVILHEYVHFIHPNHQAGFHEMMAKLMPDYRKRRAILRL